MNLRLPVYFILLQIVISSNGQAQFIEGRTYISQRPIDSIRIDGEAKEFSWTEANWTREFVDIEAANKITPYLKTRVKMLWDDDYFYFYAELEEPQVWANLKQRDTIIYWDNDFELFIDPDGDTHNYYELEVNALNTVWDLMLGKPYRDGGKAITSWDMQGLRTAVDIDGTLNNPNDIDKFWSIEAAIPWKVLLETLPKADRKIDGRVMRLNFSRVQWPTEIINGKYVKKEINGKRLRENNWVWSPQRAVAMHEPEFWGRVYFSASQVGGQDNYQFTLNEEKVRQAIFVIHRLQRSLLKKEGSFSNSKEFLNSSLLDLGYDLEWTLDADKYWYHVKMNDPYTSNLVWHIDETGRLWSEILITNE